MSDQVLAIPHGSRPIRGHKAKFLIDADDVSNYEQFGFIQFAMPHTPIVNVMDVDHNGLLLDEDHDGTGQYLVDYENNLVTLAGEILSVGDTISIKYLY